MKAHCSSGHRAGGGAGRRPGRMGVCRSVLDAGPGRGSGLAPVRGGVHLAGMDVMLHRIGWSVKVPARRGAERDEGKIARWREDTWLVIRRGGGPGAWLCFQDESGQGLRPPEGPHLRSARP